MTDNVNNPSHYTFGKYECIDVLTELCNANNLQGVEGFFVRKYNQIFVEVQT